MGRFFPWLKRVLAMAIDPGFSILVDTAESNPYTFHGIRSDADQGYEIYWPRTIRANLGRSPDSYGDYSVFGLFGSVAVERKSREDCWGTILGWPSGWEQDRGLPGRRNRFEGELANLNEIDSAVVVVECSLAHLVETCPQWPGGKKSAEENAKILFRSIISYQQRFPRVQWAFLDNRRWSEIYTFRFLRRYWLKHKEDVVDVQKAQSKAIRQGNQEVDGGTGKKLSAKLGYF